MYFENKPFMDEFSSAEIYRQRFQIEGIKALLKSLQSQGLG